MSCWICLCMGTTALIWAIIGQSKASFLYLGLAEKGFSGSRLRYGFTSARTTVDSNPTLSWQANIILNRIGSLIRFENQYPLSKGNLNPSTIERILNQLAQATQPLSLEVSTGLPPTADATKNPAGYAGLKPRYRSADLRPDKAASYSRRSLPRKVAEESRRRSSHTQSIFNRSR